MYPRDNPSVALACQMQPLTGHAKLKISHQAMMRRASLNTSAVWNLPRAGVARPRCMMSTEVNMTAAMTAIISMINERV
jgi:hypothetical protein